MENKKGITTSQSVAMIFVGLFLMIFLIALAFGVGLVDDAFSSVDLTIGNKSFNQTYTEHMRPGVIATKTTVPRNIGIGTLLGMVLTMLLVAYKIEKRNPLWIILDVVILIVAEIFAIYAKLSYETFINSHPAFLEIAMNTLTKSSTFILSLPVILPIIGSVIVLITYVKPEDKREELVYG